MEGSGRDEGRDFESFLIQEMFQCLRLSKTPTTPLRPQLDAMLERYTKTAEENLREVELQ
jgi:hypothetical protein